MWLVAETVGGNYLEYWHNKECVLSLSCDDAIDALEELKRLLNKSKIRPNTKSILVV